MDPDAFGSLDFASDLDEVFANHLQFVVVSHSDVGRKLFELACLGLLPYLLPVGLTGLLNRFDTELPGTLESSVLFEAVH